MFQIAICDDNVGELSNMAWLISQYQASRNVHIECALYRSGLELLSDLESGKLFDIYCLDIMMPGLTGIEAAREIRGYDKTAPLVFITASPEYALEGYSVKAANYILKPITQEKIDRLFDELLEQIESETQEAAVIVKSTEGIQKILVSNLVFVEIIGRNVLYHLRSGKVIECSESFSAVCAGLMKYGRFFRPHRSYLVNMQYVDTIDNHQLTLQTLATIPVAQGRSRAIKQQYLAYQMEAE